MAFKQMLDADISAIFSNTDEFAEPHDINGQSIDCVIDENLSIKRGSRQSENYDGIYARRITVFVAESVLGYRPERDQKMTVDNECYFVIECAADDGMLEFELGANRA